MPTPDASAFTVQKKYNALAQSNNSGGNPITHLYQYVPTTSGLSDFLPSFTNKITRGFVFLGINKSNIPPNTGVSYYRPPYIR